MLYYIKFGCPLVRKKGYKKNFRDKTKRWINYDSADILFGSYAYYVDEDMYRIWINDPYYEQDTIDL